MNLPLLLKSRIVKLDLKNPSQSVEKFVVGGGDPLGLFGQLGIVADDKAGSVGQLVGDFELKGVAGRQPDVAGVDDFRLNIAGTGKRK